MIKHSFFAIGLWAQPALVYSTTDLDSQKFFCNILFLLAFLADQNIFWSRPGIYANLLTVFHTTKNEEPGTLNSQEQMSLNNY